MKANQKAVGIVEDHQAMIFEMLITAVFAVVIGYAAMNIGIFINGTVSDKLVQTYPANHPANYTGAGEAATWRTTIQNATFNNLKNNSMDISTNSKMIGTAFLITIITLPLMAVVMIKKFV